MRLVLITVLAVLHFGTTLAQSNKDDLVSDFCSKGGALTISGWAHPMSSAQYYSVSRSYGDNWDINITYKFGDRYWKCAYHLRMNESGEFQSLSADCGDHQGWFSCFSGMNGLKWILSKLTEDEKNTAIRLTGKLLNEITAIDAALGSLYLKWKSGGWYYRY